MRSAPRRCSSSRTRSKAPGAARANTRPRSSSRGMAAFSGCSAWNAASWARAASASASSAARATTCPGSRPSATTSSRPATSRRTSSTGTVSRDEATLASRPDAPASATMSSSGSPPAAAAAPRLRRRATGSRTTAPPTVAAGEYERTTSRSPRPATAFFSSRSCTRRVVPGSMAGGASSTRTRASTSALATWTRTRAWSLQRPLAGEQRQLRVQDRRRLERARPREHVAAVDVGHLHAGEVDRRPVAGLHPLRGRAVHLQPAHARAPPRGQQLQLVAGGDRPRHQRARDHGAEALEDERAVHREPDQPARRPPRRPRGQPSAARRATRPAPRPSGPRPAAPACPPGTSPPPAPAPRSRPGRRCPRRRRPPW